MLHFQTYCTQSPATCLPIKRDTNVVVLLILFLHTDLKNSRLTTSFSLWTFEQLDPDIFPTKYLAFLIDTAKEEKSN